MSLRMPLNQADDDGQILATEAAALHNADLRHASGLAAKQQGVQRKMKTDSKGAKLLHRTGIKQQRAA